MSSMWKYIQKPWNSWCSHLYGTHKNEIWPMHQVLLHFLEWWQLLGSFQEAPMKFFTFFYTIICTLPFCNIFTYLMSSSQMSVSWSMVQLFRFKIFKKIVCIIILHFVKVWQIQVWGVYIWPSVQFHFSKACIICSMYLVVYFVILLGYLL